jgi:hypothetical protein
MRWWLVIKMKVNAGMMTEMETGLKMDIKRSLARLKFDGLLGFVWVSESSSYRSQSTPSISINIIIAISLIVIGYSMLIISA